MNNSDNTIFLRHILDCIGKINRYLQGYDFEKFRRDEEKIDAVVRNVEVFGEAVNNSDRRVSFEHAADRMEKNHRHAQQNYSRLRDGGFGDYLEYYAIRSSGAKGTNRKDFKRFVGGK